MKARGARSSEAHSLKQDTENWEVGGRVHMLGVCGVGMAGVAYLLARRGWRVSGCDAHLNALSAWLRAAAVEVQEGHDPAHVENADRVIVTPAVSVSEPEVRAACANALPVYRRGEVLASLLSKGRGVAVCGAHGKTTTSCFATRLLQELGASPEWSIGGATHRLGGVAGGAGELLVAEADESDGTLACYHPAVTVLTNIDLDHLEHFDGEAALLACFRQAVVQTREGVAVCRDNERAWRVAQAAAAPVLDFGFSEEAALRAAEVRVEAESVSFDLRYRGAAWGRVTLGVSGRHNVLNALGAAAAALLLGFDPRQVVGALARACDELPGRRFEPLAEVPGFRLIADYAHHPAELKAAVEMARVQRPERLVVVFQPHRYTRTRALGPEFPAAFEAADEVILLPVYAASEAPLEGGDLCDLYRHFRESKGVGPKVKLARSRQEAWQYLRHALKSGDLLLIAGAGDVIELADLIRSDVSRGWPGQRDPAGFEEALRQVPGVQLEPFGPLSGWSFYGAGGLARWRVEVEDEAALTAVLRLCGGSDVPWRMVGAGANAWFSDLGEPGCVIRFGEGACRAFHRRDGEIEVGCGWRGPALLDRLEREGLSGLEFLDSVPGSVGGWLAMNAGAHGGEISARVNWIRCLNPDGNITILGPLECGFSSRRCSGLQGRIALSCGLSLARAARESVAAARREVRSKRLPLAGLRTAGSVFRNPAGGWAGRLLDAAGCKELRVGGARVTAFHANVVAVHEGVAASDILALAMWMRNRVMSQCGVALEPEISGLSF